MIDLHTHILPGVDDGAPDLETSVLMAAVAAESGVTHLVATPHSNQRGAFENYASPALQVRFDCLCAAVREAGIPLELSLGMEIFGTGDVPKLLREGRLLTINGGRYLLIEFGFHEDPLRIERLLDQLLAAGYWPVVVIMGGGIGSRFWPFSRKTMPKQFLDFFGTGRSLLQQTFDRFNKIIPTENILIVTNAIYADLVKEQLPELDPKQILLEPARRNTAPCIAWASYHIRALNPNANIVVAPSDHLILKEGEFLAAIEKGLDFVSKSDKLLTLGIKPNRPETGYGYIQIAEQEGDNFYKVKTFTEKPELELAKVFVESGEFYWNSGLFMWNVNTIIKAGETLLPELASKLAPGREIYGTPEEKDFIEENFPACPNVSIDFGIMEKADNVYVSLGDFGWSDLGTWGSLYDLSPKDEQRNVTLKCDSLIYNSNDNIVVLPKGKLAVIEGLEGFLVAESDNVLLICKKDEEHAIRKYVNDAQMKLGEDYI